MIFIGTSGYNYPHWWNDIFYPAVLPQRKWLEFYAGRFNTVEINVSFYRLPTKEVFQSWYQRTPSPFLFGMKGNRFITHVKGLKECREPLSRLLENASPLKEKLGVILWQLPFQFRFEIGRLEEFCVLLSTLPRSKSLRHAFEFKDKAWLRKETFQLLEEFNFAVCIAHGPGLQPVETVTADFIYLRFLGGESLYGSSHSEADLEEWADTIGAWNRKGKSVFVFFNNDAYGFAIKNALTLNRLVFHPSSWP
jgi:uncharacterized protein YecE (DUF72 family)